MSEVNMSNFENTEGKELRATAEAHRDFLRTALTEENVEAWKTGGLIDDESASLLAECLNEENYIAMSPEKQAHVDQLVESIRESGADA